MPPIVTFLLGLTVLGLFGWYFATEFPARRRVLGLALILLLVGLCLLSIYPPSERIHLGLDLKGGTEFQIRLVKDNKDIAITPKMQETAVEVIRSRVDRFGVGEPVISPVAGDEILVQIPGLDAQKVSDARETLRRVAKLEFKLVYPNSEALIPQIERGLAIIPPGYQIMTMEERTSDPLALANPNAPKPKPIERKLLVRSHPDLEGNAVTAANAGFGTQGWVVNLRLDSPGARIFGDLTSQHVGEQLAIVLDNKVLSDPVLRVPIYDGNCEISGNFTEAAARDLASALENPLSTPVSIEQERSVSATLGKDSIWRGVLSGIVGVGLTFIFVLVYYRFAGLLANLALLINIVLLFGMMTMFNFVLTLPGIAGIILTIGLAIDANVLIYERLREELATGKSLRPALEGAYSKAFSSIFDANVTTLITSVILFWYAAGPVKGFAVALTLGIIASLFSALVVTRNGFSWATEKFGLQKVRMLNLLHSPHFDFMGKARYCVLGSLTVIVLCIAVFAYRGQGNFGIDFKGGDLTVLTMAHPLSVTDARRVLPNDLQEQSSVQDTSRVGEPQLTFRSPVDTGVVILKRLQEAYPQDGVKLGQYDKVGALVGKQLATKSFLALLLGIVGILIYVSLRFEFSFAIGAIVALLHDVIITIGVFSLLGRELSLVLVGAVLTIAGYSINDTIVVYDRIRSGLREGRKGSVRQIMNASINETLGRTVLTGGMTLVTVLALYIGGGPVLNDFALAILIGVVVGTYSSVFVASPIVLYFSRGEKERLRPEAPALAENAL
jgi:SecD/SecF fusion protein